MRHASSTPQPAQPYWGFGLFVVLLLSSAAHGSFKVGPLQFSPTAEASLAYDTNITRLPSDEIADFVLRASLGLNGSLALPFDNSLSYGASFDTIHYLDNADLSSENSNSSLVFVPTLDLGLGIALSETVRLDFTDNLVVSQDATGSIGRDEDGELLNNLLQFNRLENTFRASLIWDVNSINSLSFSFSRTDLYPFDDEFRDTQRVTETFALNWRHILNARVTLGLGGGLSRTHYETNFQNDSEGRFVNASLTWSLTDLIILTADTGYTWSDIERTGVVNDLSGGDAGTGWDVGLQWEHSFTSIMSYALAYRRSLDFGFVANRTKVDSLSWDFTWLGFFRNDLLLSVEYLWAEDSGGIFAEDYERLSVTTGLEYAFSPDLRTRLGYRFTQKWSNFAEREYTQHVVDVTLTYAF